MACLLQPAAVSCCVRMERMLTISACKAQSHNEMLGQLPSGSEPSQLRGTLVRSMPFPAAYRCRCCTCLQVHSATMQSFFLCRHHHSCSMTGPMEHRRMLEDPKWGHSLWPHHTGPRYRWFWSKLQSNTITGSRYACLRMLHSAAVHMLWMRTVSRP